MSFTRRKFLGSAGIVSGGAMLGGLPSALAQQPLSTTESKFAAQLKQARSARPVIVTRVTGTSGTDEAYELLRKGGDTLDAALIVCKAQEDDANDQSVGLGGLPNEEGIVELDSCVMHGPTRRAGAVAGVRDIKNVCLVAKQVMERTSHVLLVGEGATRFAVAEGFPKENLLTDKSRRDWLLWKENMSNQDDWGPGISSPDWVPPHKSDPSLLQQSTPRAGLTQKYQNLMAKAEGLGIDAEHRQKSVEFVMYPPTGTIHVSACNEKGEISGATTTSGLAWKIPGRVGDSAIIGAGCFTDQDVGSAGATGSGEENIKVAGAHTIVELMRRGYDPVDAGLETLKRIVHNYDGNMDKVRYIDMIYYILRRDGKYAAVALWSHSPTGQPRKFVVHDGNKRIEDCAFLLKGESITWPPVHSSTFVGHS